MGFLKRLAGKFKRGLRKHWPAMLGIAVGGYGILKAHGALKGVVKAGKLVATYGTTAGLSKVLAGKITGGLKAAWKATTASKHRMSYLHDLCRGRR